MIVSTTKDLEVLPVDAARVRNMCPPSIEQIEEQLRRILSSRDLLLPERGMAFLEFVVTETLAGRQEYLKAFTIATRVFGRDAEFDAQNDPCVRSEAKRVRWALERYYLIWGKDDAIIITVPTGGYRPQFAVRQAATAVVLPVARPGTGETKGSVANHPRLTPLVVTVCVVTIISLSILGAHRASIRPDSQQDYIAIRLEHFDGSSSGQARSFAKGLRDEIINQLFPHRGVRILTDRPDPRARLSYTLQGSASVQGSFLHSTIKLLQEGDGRVVWAKGFDVPLNQQGQLPLYSDLAQTIAESLLRNVKIGEEPGIGSAQTDR